MKILILLATILSYTFAIENFDLTSLDFKKARFDLDQESADKFIEKFEEAKLGGGDESKIIAVIDEYADQIFGNLQILALADGLDPISLGDINSEKFLTASVTLTNGLLHGISTIKRSDDVELIYSSNGRLLELYLPIAFTNLYFTYDYHLIILLIGPRGSLTGKIENFSMDLKLSFDFNTYHAEVESVSTRNTGHVDLVLDGDGTLEIVINTLSEFVTTILHPLIVRGIEGIVRSVADEIVDAVNSFLDGVLHPSNEVVNAIFKEKIYLL